jgi:bifunctional non-homologous end joining protein LigD
MARADDLETPTAVVFDLDPGPGTAIRECCQVAVLLRDILDSVGLEGWAKTSGSKGVQVYVPINAPLTHERASSFALACGQVLEKQHRRFVTTVMARSERPGKVFVDWSQNARHKTTIGVYSLRARPHPTVSTPVSWEEVERCADGALDLVFSWREVLARVDEGGDLFAPVLTRRQELPGAA